MPLYDIRAQSPRYLTASPSLARANRIRNP